MNFRALSLLLAAAAACVILTAGPALAETIYVKGEKARFRTGPGSNYDIKWEAPRYMPLEYLAKYMDWYAVRDHEGDVGWVHEQVIGKGMAAIVTKKKANVRKKPNIKSSVVFYVEKDYLFKVLERKGDWYKVKTEDGDEGWVFQKLVWVSK